MKLINQNRGFSMLEVLVAAFIFATGILGIAALQMKSLGVLSNSHSVNTAMIGASDLADRMMANPPGLPDDSGNDSYVGLDETATDPSCGTTCTPDQLAQFDVFSVSQEISRELPNATLDITLTGDVYTIEVTWTEQLGDQAAETKRHRISFLPYQPQ